MKKILLSSLMAAAAAVPALAGVDNINYQAVIKNGNDVVASKAVEMKFELLDKDGVVYTEEQTATTNAAGYVSCQLGGEELNTIEWGDLTLRVSINLGNGYEVISNEAVSSVPTALYALRSADSDEIKEAVEGLMEDTELNKETILGINAEIVKFNGFMDDVDAFNTDLVEKLEPMMGLNYAEINDFHERVSDALINLQNTTEELETNTDAFATMLEARLDKMQKQIDLADATADENYDDLKGAADRSNLNITVLQGKVNELEELVADNYDDLKGDVERLDRNITLLQSKQNEDIEALTEQTDAFATMVETRMDKIQNQVDLLDPEVEGLVKDMEDVKNNVKDMGADVAQIEGLAEKVEQLEENIAIIASPTDPESMMNQINGALGELGEAVEGLVNENEETKSNLKNLSADVAQIEGISEKLEDIDGQLENLNNVSAVVRANEEAIEALQGDFKNIGENLTNSFTAVNTQIEELNGQLENLNNFTNIVKEEYATNESVEAAFTMLQTTLDKMQKQLDLLEEEVNALKGE